MFLYNIKLLIFHSTARSSACLCSTGFSLRRNDRTARTKPAPSCSCFIRGPNLQPIRLLFLTFLQIQSVILGRVHHLWPAGSCPGSGFTSLCSSWSTAAAKEPSPVSCRRQHGGESCEDARDGSRRSGIGKESSGGHGGRSAGGHRPHLHRLARRGWLSELISFGSRSKRAKL